LVKNYKLKAMLKQCLKLARKAIHSCYSSQFVRKSVLYAAVPASVWKKIVC